MLLERNVLLQYYNELIDESCQLNFNKNESYNKKIQVSKTALESVDIVTNCYIWQQWTITDKTNLKVVINIILHFASRS